MGIGANEVVSGVTLPRLPRLRRGAPTPGGAKKAPLTYEKSPLERPRSVIKNLRKNCGCTFKIIKNSQIEIQTALSRLFMLISLMTLLHLLR